MSKAKPLQKPRPIRANSLLFAGDFTRPVVENLERGVTVTPFYQEDDKGVRILIFEVVVKVIGKTRVPRVTAFPD